MACSSRQLHDKLQALHTNPFTVTCMARKATPHSQVFTYFPRCNANNEAGWLELKVLWIFVGFDQRHPPKHIFFLTWWFIMSTHEACVVERLKQCEEKLQKSATTYGSDMSHVPRVPRSTIRLASILGKGSFSVGHKAKMNLPRKAPPCTTTTTNSFTKLPTSSKKPTYAIKCLRDERIILP